MKKQIAITVCLLLPFVAVSFGQPATEGRALAAMREARMNALTDLQQNAAKVKAIMEATAKAMQGRSFQDMSDQERTQTQQQFQEQQKLIAAMAQDMARLNIQGLAEEDDHATTQLKDILATAQKENAKETVAKLEKLLADRDKQFRDMLRSMLPNGEVQGAARSPADEYQRVDPGQLSFELRGFAQRSAIGKDGVPVTVGGYVKELLCEGTSIELMSHEFSGEFLQTKEYGKIKIQFSNSLTSGGFSVWLMPSQRESLIKKVKPALKNEATPATEASGSEDQYTRVAGREAS